MKNIYDKTEEWLEFSKSVTNIYLKIIEHEQQGDKNSDEYQSLFYILPTAVDIEKTKLTNILTKENYQNILKNVDKASNIFTDVMNEEKEFLPIVRAYNQLMSTYYFTYNGFFEEKTAKNPIDLINNTVRKNKLGNAKYEEYFFTILAINCIQIITRHLDSIEDNDIKNYLIYLKYVIITITPLYERRFLLTDGVLPLRNMITSFPSIEGYEESQIKELLIYSLESLLLEDMKRILKLNNDNIKYVRKEITLTLITNKARLLSNPDLDFIESLEKQTYDMMNDSDSSCDRIKNLIKEMFKDTKLIINEEEAKKKQKPVQKKIQL